MGEGGRLRSRVRVLPRAAGVLSAAKGTRTEALRLCGGQPCVRRCVLRPVMFGGQLPGLRCAFQGVGRLSAGMHACVHAGLAKPMQRPDEQPGALHTPVHRAARVPQGGCGDCLCFCPLPLPLHSASALCLCRTMWGASRTLSSGSCACTRPRGRRGAAWRCVSWRRWFAGMGMGAGGERWRWRRARYAFFACACPRSEHEAWDVTIMLPPTAAAPPLEHAHREGGV